MKAALGKSSVQYWRLEFFKSAAFGEGKNSHMHGDFFFRNFCGQVVIDLNELYSDLLFFVINRMGPPKGGWFRESTQNIPKCFDFRYVNHCSCLD